MTIRVEAVYENGMLRPLEPLALSEHQLVVLTLSEATSPRLQRDEKYLAAVREQVAKEGPPPGLDEVRRRLAKIPGSMTADFIAEREDR
jgi:predicted DNA-binding antitoxin AbrB/MazE fold protein